MSNIFSHGCSTLVHAFGLRRLAFAVALLLPATLLADTVRAQDFLRIDRGVARSWTLHKIALIQAAAGDIVGAKNTVADIDAPDFVRGEGDVTAVSSHNGQPFYDHPPASNQSERCQHMILLNPVRTPDHVPAAVPQGLPTNYLAADPHHGVLVNFADEYDCNGTRVTSRRYADGYIVIETPRAEKTR